METNELINLEWHTAQRTVRELIPYEHNPRILTEEKREVLRQSLEKFNLVEIPVANLDGVVIAGHQRLKVMYLLGRADEVIDVRMPNRQLTEQELKEYNVRSNVSIGEWDLDILSSDIFNDIDLGSLGLEMEYEPRPLPVPITQAGDLYELHSVGKAIIHRLQCGDSTDPAAVARLLDGASINLVCTDPPYNVNYQGKTKDALKIANDKMSDSSFYNFLHDHYVICFENMAAGAPIYVFHADSEGANFRLALKEAGLKLSQCLVWVKQTFVMGRQDYHWQHEPVLYGWKEGAAHTWYSDRKQSTVLNFDKPSRNEQHPTMKPIPLVRYLVENSSKPGDVVFDGFAGSGSTLITCEMTGRTCYTQDFWDPAGTEPNYCDSIVDRWVKHMKHNGLAFEVTRNGETLDEHELARYSAD